MGIDKSDVRYIIHFDIPKSLEGYYQETGRAGRDGSAAKCIFFYSREDVIQVKKFVSMSHNQRQVTADMNDGPPPSQRAIDSLTALINLVENTDVCRHVSLCRYFGEVIDIRNPDVMKNYCDKMCDVCKYPEKTRKRKQKLSSPEDIGYHHLASAGVENGGALAHPQAKAPSRGAPGPRPSSRKDDAGASLPRVASTSTVLAPITARSNYVGPALLRSRPQGLKRTASVSSAGSSEGDASKKPRTTYTATSSHLSGRSVPFRTPFKVPFQKQGPETEPEPVLLVDEYTTGEDTADVPVQYLPPVVEDEFEPPSSPVKLPDQKIELEVAFSQKIPTAVRNAAFKDIRQALHKMFMLGPMQAVLWRRLRPAPSESDARDSVIFAATKALEHQAFNMSAREEGYRRRTTASIRAVRHVAEECVWEEPSGSEEHEDARDIIAVLQRSCQEVRRNNGKEPAL
ncbi:P-loop containing nucleoside triphosphate hydrolase protein [Auriscalpium vulgare]|uniref:P-loop containing nucleoside triphosphate hydrolase protein n=1 Tax=Auriscalpium vulgare TaxID=40419 RepID=A0ACB8RHP1_9AGAM|nr:P-loop containing nucleoside triphosphate hydrolase protein [Auriscalpium vulgare]